MKSSPVIAATVTRRESYPEWRARREAESTWSEQDAIAAAKRVVDVCADIRTSHPPTPTMEEVVESIRIAPPRPAPTGVIDPHTIRLARRLPMALGIFMVFLAGLALGRVL